jgi:hypothetical protein
VPNLPPGYRLKSLTRDGTDLRNTPFVVDARKHGDIEIVLEATTPMPWVQVAGRVTGLTGKSTADLKVLLTGADTSQTLEAAVDGAGAFKFDRVRPGAYTATLLPADNATEGAQVTIGADNVENLSLALKPRAQLRGRVVVEGGGAPPAFTVRLDPIHPPSGPPTYSLPLDVKPDKDGVFTLSASEGTYFVSVAVPGFEYQLRLATAGTTDLFRNPLTLPNAGDLVLTFVK